MIQKAKLSVTIQFDNQIFKLGDIVAVMMDTQNPLECLKRGRIVKITPPTKETYYMGELQNDNAIITLDMSDRFHAKTEDIYMMDIKMIHIIE